MANLNAIVSSGASDDDDEFLRLWEATETAGEQSLVPKGEYEAHIRTVKRGVSKKGNPKLTVEFQIVEGPHAGRRLWRSHGAAPGGFCRPNGLWCGLVSMISPTPCRSGCG